MARVQALTGEAGEYTPPSNCLFLGSIVGGIVSGIFGGGSSSSSTTTTNTTVDVDVTPQMGVAIDVPLDELADAMRDAGASQAAAVAEAGQGLQALAEALTTRQDAAGATVDKLAAVALGLALIFLFWGKSR